MNKITKRKPYRSESTLKKVERFVRLIEPISQDEVAKKLVSFSVTVDSVVATVNLVFDHSHSRIVLHWGDDETEVINLGQLRSLSSKLGNDQEPNTLTFQHVYKPPFDHGRTILVAVTSDRDGRKSFDTAVIEIDPRYKLDFYSLVLEFPEHLDSTFQTDSEVDALLSVYQDDQNILGKHWKDSVETNPVEPSTDEKITWKLNDSGFGLEISYSEEPIYIRLDLEEDDKLLDDDHVVKILVNTIWDVVTLPIKGIYHFVKFIGATADGFDSSTFINQITMPIEIHPRNLYLFDRGSNDLMAEFTLWPDGKIYARFKFELKLIVPINRNHGRMVAST